MLETATLCVLRITSLLPLKKMCKLLGSGSESQQHFYMDLSFFLLSWSHFIDLSRCLLPTTAGGIPPLVQPFENLSFNVTAVKSNHEINSLTLFPSISHPTRPNLLCGFLLYHTFLYCPRLFFSLSGHNFRGGT